MNDSYHNIEIKNELTENIKVYDAFQNDQSNKNLTNFFGTLTSIVTIQAGETKTFTPIHGPVSTYIVFDEQNNPITRFFTTGFEATSFSITQKDVNIISTTQNFIKLMKEQPKNEDVEQFNALIKNGKSSAKQVNDFFQSTTNFNTVTFISYMLEIVALARTPETQHLPPQEQVYSLSTLVNNLGFEWPSIIPDVSISHFNCFETDEAIIIGGELDITQLTFAEGVLGHIQTFIGDPVVNFKVKFIYNDGLATGVTCLIFKKDQIKNPIENGKTFNIKNPMIILSLNPLFKFLVFEIKATIPFNIFNSPTINADIAMTIDNIEAEIGVALRGNATTLYIRKLYFRKSNGNQIEIL